MSTARVKFAKPAKLALSCNTCKQPCPPKDGDWHESAGPDSQQIFLCRRCESKARFAGSMNFVANPRRTSSNRPVSYS
jgi:hypothetical protein